MNAVAYPHTYSTTAPVSVRAYGFRSALGDALASALQWRVLLFWIIALTALAMFGAGPLSGALSKALDHHPDAVQIAQGENIAQFGNLAMSISGSGAAIGAGFKSAIAITLLLLPWFAGLASTAVQPATRAAGFSALFTGAFREYPRQLGLVLWSLLPLLVGFAVFGGASHLAQNHAEKATLESSADLAKTLALVAGGIAVLIAHASVEAGRAFFAVQTSAINPVKAWWRGVKLLLRRPLHTLGLYALASLPGLLVALVIALIRVRIAGVGAGAWLAAFVIVQLGIAALAWSRIARLKALTSLASDECVQQRYR